MQRRLSGGRIRTLRRNVPALDSAVASVYLPTSCLCSPSSAAFRAPSLAPVPSSTGHYAADGRRLGHEIKHDGFRIVARREGNRVRLFTRNGYDFTARFPKIAAAVADLPVRSCVVDGEAIVVNREGLSVFDLLRYRHHDHAAVLCAFDLIELDGFDLRQQPLERRKDTLAYLLRTAVTALLSTAILWATEWPFLSMHAFSVARASCQSF